MAEKEIESLLETAMGNLRQMVDANTVVGTMMTVGDNCNIIPLSKVTCGFVAGGGEYGKGKDSGLQNGAFCGGSGGGLTVAPLGFIAITGDVVRFVPVESGNSATEKLVEAVPSIFQQVQKWVNKKEAAQTSCEQTTGTTASTEPASANPSSATE